MCTLNYSRGVKLLHFKFLQWKYWEPSGSLMRDRLRQLPSPNSNWGPPTYLGPHLPSCIVPCCRQDTVMCRLSLLIFLSHLKKFDSCLRLSSVYKRTWLFKYGVIEQILTYLSCIVWKLNVVLMQYDVSDWFRKYDGHSVVRKTFSAGERPQTFAVEGGETGIGIM